MSGCVSCATQSAYTLLRSALISIQENFDIFVEVEENLKIYAQCEIFFNGYRRLLTCCSLFFPDQRAKPGQLSQHCN